MGLGVETVILAQVFTAAAGRGVARLVGEFAPTAKNGPCADFFERHGFRADGEAGGVQRWVLDLGAARIEAPAWITVKETGASA
jgi:predicted enzyme involved in methoxymalonyl-ACP biosynthesis